MTAEKPGELPVAPTSSANPAALVVATGFGLGHTPAAPGSAGSLAGVALFALLAQILEGPLLGFACFVIGFSLFVLAGWSTAAAQAHWNKPDPQQVVIDEVLGQFLTYAPLAIPLTAPWFAATAQWKILAAGFILFRAFDVLKPFPIKRSERLSGPWGVVMDDVLAAAYAGAALALVARLGWLR